MNKRTIAAIVGASLTVGVLGLGTGGAFASDKVATTGRIAVQTAASKAPQPPKGARAVVRVSPNPTAKRGEELTITGHCGGGEKLKAVFDVSKFSDIKPILKNIRIVNEDPKGFMAKATLTNEIGYGVGPVFVDCGGEAGVTLLVTQV